MQIKIAKNMLSQGLGIATIAAATGLDSEFIQSLQLNSKS